MVQDGFSVSHGEAKFGSVSVPFLMDYGASRCFISDTRVFDIMEAGAATFHQLDTPFVLHTASATGDLTATASLVATITLRNEEGCTVQINNLEIFVVTGLVHGVMLLGRNLWEALGFSRSDLFKRVDGVTVDMSHNVDVVPMSAQLVEPVLNIPAANPEAMQTAQPTSEEDELEQETPDIAIHVPEDVHQALCKNLQSAEEAGLSAAGTARLKAVVLGDCEDAFRLVLSNDPPCNVEPIRVHFKPEVYGVHHGVRKYSKTESEFMDSHLATLEAFGLVYRNPLATIASPAYPVRKAGANPLGPPESQYRLTVDLRGVNSHTIPTVFPLPLLETFVDDVAGMKYFGTLDLFNGYWQLPLHPDCQEMFSIKTDHGVWTPTRLIQGSRNAAGPFQATVAHVLRERMHKGCIVYIDDVLVYGATEEEFISNWIFVIRSLHASKLKISAKKTVFFRSEVNYCGRVFSPKGTHFNPEFISTVTKMPRPGTAHELRTYLATTNWMRSAIPSYAGLTAELQELLTTATRAAANTRKPAMSKVLLDDIGWSDVHDQAFNRLNHAIASAVTIAYQRDDMTTCVFTDASDKHWAGVVTQVPPDQLDRPVMEQEHVPLGFVSGHFNGASARWPTVEQEGFAIKETCSRLAYLLRRPQQFIIFTDHRNLTYLFSSEPSVSDGRKQAADRIQRWMVLMRSFPYSIRHIPGEQNVAADMLSRWGATPDSTTAPPAAESAQTVFIHGDDALFDTYDVPELEEIRDAQVLNTLPDERVSMDLHINSSDLLVTPDDKTYIPNTRHLRLRLCIGAHQGLAGHRGVEVTSKWLLERFWWPNIKTDVVAFCKVCLVCAKTRGPLVIPRPMLETFHPTGPHQVLHFDFTYVRATTPGTLGGFEQVLVLKDGFSKFVNLIPVVSANADSVVQALLDWFKLFGIVQRWCSDQGSHFLNAVMALLAQKLRIHHHLTAVYAPWSNGQIERVNREFHELLSAISLEGQLQDEQWPAVLPAITFAINNNPTRRLGGLAPITIQIGRAPSNPLDWWYDIVTHHFKPIPLSMDEFKEKVEALSAAHDSVINDINDQPRAPRRENSAVSAIDFVVGDYVLVSNRSLKTRDKVRPSWEGPALVSAEVSPYVYSVKDIGNNLSRNVHAKFLKRYANGELAVTKQLREFAAHGGQGFTISNILDHQKDHGVWKLKIHWEGFPLDEATWESAARIVGDVPTMVRGYLNAVPNSPQLKELKKHLKIDDSWRQPRMVAAAL